MAVIDFLVESNTVVAAKDQLGCKLGEEEVVLDLVRGVYYGLNGVGSRIWELVQKPITVGEIVDTVSCEYEVGRAQCQDEVRQFLSELAEHSLIQHVSCEKL